MCLLCVDGRFSKIQSQIIMMEVNSKSVQISANNEFQSQLFMRNYEV